MSFDSEERREMWAQEQLSKEAWQELTESIQTNEALKKAIENWQQKFCGCDDENEGIQIIDEAGIVIGTVIPKDPMDVYGEKEDKLKNNE